MPRILIPVLFFLAVAFSSCDKATVYSEHRSLPFSGWDADSALNFNFSVKDTLSSYSVIINVRHTDAYPYQNMWLLVTDNHIPQTYQQTDTIEFYLANQRGEWLGSGNGRLHEMPVLYLKDCHFADTTMQHISIRHGMREDVLKGVSDICLRIERNR